MNVALLAILLSYVITADAFFTFPMNARSLAAQQVRVSAAKGLDTIKARYLGRDDLITTTSVVEDAEEEEGGEDDEAEEEVEEEDVAVDYADFLLADEQELDPPQRGQTLSGVIVEIDDNGALVEIGGKMSGFLPLKEVMTNSSSSSSLSSLDDDAATHRPH